VDYSRVWFLCADVRPVGQVAQRFTGDTND